MSNTRIDSTTNRPVMVITGGSRGIGAATAHLAAKKGWDVCIGYLSAIDAARLVAESVFASGGRCLACHVDVADEEDVKSFFRRVDAEMGPIAALVNNAGTTGSGRRRIEQVSTAGINDCWPLM